MSYAIRKDGQGWRMVNGADAVGDHEVYSKTLPTPSTARIKAMRWAAIKAERDRRINSGGYLIGGHWFHSDQESRLRQMGLALLDSGVRSRLRRIGAALGRGASSGHFLKTMDGRVVTMTASLARRIVAAAAVSDQALFSAAERHKAALEASADPACYDFSDGWPKAFGE